MAAWRSERRKMAGETAQNGGKRRSIESCVAKENEI
jgi:hypothetical protein